MTESKAFAFRVPPELKAAAVALTDTSFHEWKDDGSRPIRDVAPSSINEAFIYLIRTGAGKAAQLIERDLEWARDNVEHWRDVAKFFLDNPSAKHVTAEDFPAGSETRRRIESDDEIHRNTVGAATGLSRQDTFKELSLADRMVTTRIEAKAALLEASYKPTITATLVTNNGYDAVVLVGTNSSYMLIMDGKIFKDALRVGDDQDLLNWSGESLGYGTLPKDIGTPFAVNDGSIVTVLDKEIFEERRDFWSRQID